MAECRLCAESGFFMSVSEIGLCRNCSRIYAVEVPNRIRIVSDCLKILQNSKNLDTKVQRFNLLAEVMSVLAKYDEKGIYTLRLTFKNTTDQGVETRDLSPMQFLAEKSAQKDAVIIMGLRVIVKEALSKSEVAGTTASKTNALSKALLEVRRYKPEVSNFGGLESLEQRLLSAIQKIKFDDLLDKARKAEFKEQRKKAFEFYSDALYFLKNEAGESIRTEYSPSIEAALTKLKAQGDAEN